MAWRDDLRQGSWRGVPFRWESSDTELGRRSARHDYPQRDDASFEDMGKIPREFLLEMFVVGPDYMAERDRLAAAFGIGGPGTLVHPTFGTLTVVVFGRVKLRETTKEGGMARFTATFIVSGAAALPSVTVDTAQDVRLKAAALLEGQLLANFQRSFSIAKQPGFAMASALGGIQGLTQKLRELTALISTNLSTPEFLNDIADFQSAVSSLVQAPFLLAQSVVFQVNAALNLVTDPLARFGLAMGLFDVDFGWGRVSSATPSRRQDAANCAATSDLFKQTAILAAAMAAADIPFSSYQDAIAVRGQLLDGIDAILDIVTDDDLFTGLAGLRAAVVADITARGADLARIVSFVPAQTMPALLLAYLLYSDAAAESEIISRNAPRHPGFLTGGVPLEVKSA